MVKVFIDTNIFLDLFLARGQFADPAENLLGWCEKGFISGCTSSINITNIFYILRRQKTKSETKRLISQILGFIGVYGTSKNDLLLAMQSNFSDIEDAIQYYTALNAGDVNFIITRNIKDFKNSVIPYLLPEDFIKKFS